MKKKLLFLGYLGILVIVSVFAAKNIFLQKIEKQVVFFEPSPEHVAADIVQIEKLSIPDAVGYFRKLSQEKGAEYAYEILRNVPVDMSDYSHLFGHVIGDELYNEKNIKGLSICTTEFAFSCYHSVLARAIAEQGLEKIKEINEVCLNVEDIWGCQHGIGHGILAATGYEEPFTALDVCGTLTEQGPIRGCVEGVFMEYNLHTMLQNISETTYRGVSGEGLYYPCTEVADEYKNQCYHEQPLWWREMFGRTNYTYIASLCSEVADEENKSWCYRKIGQLIEEFPVGTPENIAKECIAAIQDSLGQAYCLQMLRDKSVSDTKVCGALQLPYKETCELPVPDR